MCLVDCIIFCISCTHWIGEDACNCFFNLLYYQCQMQIVEDILQSCNRVVSGLEMGTCHWGLWACLPGEFSCLALKLFSLGWHCMVSLMGDCHTLIQANIVLLSEIFSLSTGGYLTMPA